MRSLLLVLVACTPTETVPPSPATPVAPAPIGVVFERVLPPEWTPPKPLFGPDASITVGAGRWSSSGARLPAHGFERSGQLHVVAIAGTAQAPRAIALGWSGLVEGAREPDAYLVTGELAATTLGTPRAIAHAFLDDDDLALSPDRGALLLIEGERVVIRDAVTGAVRRELAAGAEPGKACWVDGREVAWIQGRTLHVAGGEPRTHALPAETTIVACDPGGRVAAIAVPGGIGVLELATGAVSAVLEVASPSAIAIGHGGERIAAATDDGVALYRRSGTRFSRAFALASPAREPKTEEGEEPEVEPRRRHLAFSIDGERLAVADRTLIVIGEVATPASVQVPRFHLELPRGFVAPVAVSSSWRYAQLPPLRGDQLLFSAGRPGTHVIGLALEHAELPPIPPASASERDFAAFGRATLATWFPAWTMGSTEGYTIEVGRTDGLRWFEARELHRDGCEPFDAYTRVVLDRELAYVIRAVTVPGGAIEGWLARFFDLPFTAHVQTALRPGGRPGPC